MRSPSRDSRIESRRLIPEPDDEGKDVVDDDGRDLGMVTAVVGDAMYADQNTTLSTAVERRLGWDDPRNADLRIPPALVTHIDDEVVLAVERASARSEEVG